MTGLGPAAFAAAGVFAASAAGSGDYELVLTPPSPDPVCAKSLATCQAAMEAVQNFGLFVDLRIVEMRCVSHPACFSEASQVIRGYNSPEDRR